MITTTITRFRKGQLSIPKLYVNALDTLSGDMTISRAGTLQRTLGATYSDFHKSLRLKTGTAIADNSNATMLYPTHTGAIAVLGDIQDSPDLVIASDNAGWIVCPYEGAAAVASDIQMANGENIPQGSTTLIYSVPLPTNRGALKLYISGTRVSLSDADASNYVTSTKVIAYGDTTSATLDTDATDKNTIDLHEDTFTAVDVSGYHIAKVTLSVTIGTANLLDIQFVAVRYYYST